MSFDQAFAHTVGVEGGYSNNPADPGGETMWGITARTAVAHGYLGPMKNMPIQTAKDIYKTSYWDLIHLDAVDKISPAIAAEMFDTGVNCGVSVPVKFLQRALNAFNNQGKDYPDQPVDGLFGVVGEDALRKYLSKRGTRGERVMIAALNAQQGVRYLEIVEGRPASEVFAWGWFEKRVA